jgi:hypothetical protein
MSIPAVKTYGTVSAAKQKEMSGLDFVQGTRQRHAAAKHDCEDLRL